MIRNVFFHGLVMFLPLEKHYRCNDRFECLISMHLKFGGIPFCKKQFISQSPFTKGAYKNVWTSNQHKIVKHKVKRATNCEDISKY